MNELWSVTTCSICCNVFKDPRVLPCGHTFCLECIAFVFQAISSLLCLECSQPDPRNSILDDFEKLTKNIQKRRLIEHCEQKSNAPHKNIDKNTVRLQCPSCSKMCMTDEVRHCQDHRRYICYTCVSDHRACTLVHPQIHCAETIKHEKVQLQESYTSVSTFQKVIAQEMTEKLSRFHNALSKLNSIKSLQQNNVVFHNTFQQISKDRTAVSQVLRQIYDAKVQTENFCGTFASIEIKLAEMQKRFSAMPFIDEAIVKLSKAHEVLTTLHTSILSDADRIQVSLDRLYSFYEEMLQDAERCVAFVSGGDFTETTKTHVEIKKSLENVACDSKRFFEISDDMLSNEGNTKGLITWTRIPFALNFYRQPFYRHLFLVYHIAGCRQKARENFAV